MHLVISAASASHPRPTPTLPHTAPHIPTQLQTHPAYQQGNSKATHDPTLNTLSSPSLLMLLHCGAPRALAARCFN